PAPAGENAAPTPTIAKILSGVHRPDAGDVALDGAPLSLGGPADAQDAGIAVIYQEPPPFPDLAVAPRCHLPGPHALPGPPRRGEHLHGPPAARPLAADRPWRAGRGRHRA